ncbi:separin protein [Clarireedia jacksonii]
MDSLLEAAGSVRAAISSTTTCSPATVNFLTDLLLPKSSTAETNGPQTSKTIAKTTAKTAKATKKSTVRAPQLQSRTNVVEKENVNNHGEQLSLKERSILATEVINLTLKALTEAIKAPSQVRKTADSNERAAARKGLRRSSSVPQTPLQPRSLNRVSSSPNISKATDASISSTSSCTTGVRSVAECARAGFACLRGLQASKTAGLNLPALQVENGMSVLIGKLLSLGLDDLAAKELRILKRRLDGENGYQVAKVPASKDLSSSTAPQSLAELLDFGEISEGGAKLGLIITTQLQVLRLIVSSRKPRTIEAALPLLRSTHHSSPTNLLLKTANDSNSHSKSARQLQTLSDLLLSMSPSVSTSEDDTALDPKASVGPETAFALQTIALEIRTLWWRLAGHQGDVGKDLLDPFLRCAQAYARRSPRDAVKVYGNSSNAFLCLQRAASKYKNAEIRPKSTTMGIFRLLGSLAKEANMIDEAIAWVEKVQNILEPGVDSDVKHSAVKARLVALMLRDPCRYVQTEDVLMALLNNLENPFKGEAADIDDLLMEVSSARRAAVAIVSRPLSVSDGSSSKPNSGAVHQMCESLISLCPRLSLRYLGKKPEIGTSSKDHIRFEQRRQFITKPAFHAIDSALFLIKHSLKHGSLAWEAQDSLLQDCLALIERLQVELPEGSAFDAASYNVRISNLYYTRFLNARREADSTKEVQQLHMLRRSIDCVKSRPLQERNTALISLKLERLAEFYKATAQYNKLFTTLVELRNEMVENLVLEKVVETAKSLPLRAAWNCDDTTSVLARTLQSMLKVYLSHPDVVTEQWLVDEPWTEEQKGLVLEHELDYLTSLTNPSATSIELKLDVFNRLISVYSLSQYPVRRLRTMATFQYSHDIQDSGLIHDALESLEAKRIDFVASQDHGLTDYLKNWELMAISVVELQKSKPSLEVLDKCISGWRSIRDQVRDFTGLIRYVEDIPHLLLHLQSLTNFMEMRGLETERLDILQLIADIDELCCSVAGFNDIVSVYSALGIQWLQLGYSGKAGLSLDKAQRYSSDNEVSYRTRSDLHIAYSQYMLALGNLEQCQQYLTSAEGFFQQDRATMGGKDTRLSLQEKTRMNCTSAKASFIRSMLAVEQGGPESAIVLAKQSVRLLRRAWANTEAVLERKRASAALVDNENIAEEMSGLSVTTDKLSYRPQTQSSPSGIGFWHLVVPLITGLIHLSNLYAHHGLFQETLHYAEQAEEIVKVLNSDTQTAIVSATLGNIWTKAGNLDKGTHFLTEAEKLCKNGFKTKTTVAIASQLGRLHGILGDLKTEVACYELAENTLRSLTTKLFTYNGPPKLIPVDVVEIENGVRTLAVSKRKAPAARKPATRKKAPAPRKPVASAKPHTPPEPPVSEECPQLNSLRAKVLWQKAEALLSLKKSKEAQAILEEAGKFSSTQLDAVYQGISEARCLLLRSMEQMVSDPVYSVLQDSTISFPSVLGAKADKSAVDKTLVRHTSPRKPQAPRVGRPGKGTSSDSIFDKLHRAQEILVETYPVAFLVAPISVMHKITSLLNNVSILLSAAGPIKGKSQPGLASCSIDSARTLAFRRERKVILQEIAIPELDDLRWPDHGALSRRSSLGASLSLCDIPRFQKDYIDIIPKSWTAISIALSENRQELSITKLQAGHSPFVLRLPLGRNNSMDADEEVFGFEQGKSELFDIIECANANSKDGPNRTGREAKIAWWAEREELDGRLKDLLENIEKVWLGGFAGIFSQHGRRQDLLARFQKSFENILDKHLPSRRKSKRNSGARVTLDSRILELFISLGDATAEDCDFSEPLTDLLYFVVDVLQFHGELNAYAEIDFDSIVIEIHDALRCYHEAAHISSGEEEGKHTILILDKALHIFPWESLPCMEGLAISRLPSLGCLQDRLIKQQKASADQEEVEGHYIDRSSGAYILNPDGDLKHTQTTFQQTLESLPSWTGITNRYPSEEEMKNELQSKDLFLYFGHGSGGQFIRSKEIRKMEQCAVAILMGCSSGALTDYGEFEPCGTPVHYMHACSPALVATLWDVTDKDIDRFAGKMLEEWGLFEGHEERVAGKGKGRNRKVAGKGKEKERGEIMGKISLVEAVAKGRDACKLRYLNAAAVCVYGIPVYIKE